MSEPGAMPGSSTVSRRAFTEYNCSLESIAHPGFHAHDLGELRSKQRKFLGGPDSYLRDAVTSRRRRVRWTRPIREH